MKYLIALLIASPVMAGTCQTFLHSHHTTSAFVNDHHVYRYRVKPQLEFEAVETYKLKHDKDFIEFMTLYSQFKAFKAGKAAAELQLTEPAQPIDPVRKHCGECHSGPNPEKQFLLDSSFGFPCKSVTKSIKAIRKGTMPSDKKLTQAEKDELIDYLLANEVE